MKRYLPISPAVAFSSSVVPGTAGLGGSGAAQLNWVSLICCYEYQIDLRIS